MNSSIHDTSELECILYEIGNIRLFVGLRLKHWCTQRSPHFGEPRVSVSLYCIWIWALANTGPDTQPITLLPPCASEHEPKTIFVCLYCCVYQTCLYSHDQLKDINYSCIAETLSFNKCLSMWTNKQLTKPTNFIHSRNILIKPINQEILNWNTVKFRLIIQRWCVHKKKNSVN